MRIVSPSAVALRKLGAAVRISRVEVRVSALVLLITLSTCVLLEELPKIFPVRSAVIKVDMQAEIGRYVEVYLNGSGEPLRQKLVLKQRTLYTFLGIAKNIDLLRFDPTDSAGAEVSIYSLEVDDSDGLLRRFGPADLATWASANLNSLEVANGPFHFFAANNDPSI